MLISMNTSAIPSGASMLVTTMWEDMANFTDPTETMADMSPANLSSIDMPRFNMTLFQNRSDLNGTAGQDMCEMVKAHLVFDVVQIVRVITTWVLFLISMVGNMFVLSCVYMKAKSSHVHMIMMHFTIADLAFTLLVMPNDAIWNTTMEWTVGEFLCKLCQMFKQMGMYISSFMVVVTAVDRCCSILQPMSTPVKQRLRTKLLVGGAWILSILCAIPPAILFTVFEADYCPDRPPIKQCLDFMVVKEEAHRRPYYFFTMFMTFILPMIFTVVSYSLVVYEISNMMRRDRVMMGRRDSCNNITRARRKTLIMTSMVTLTFVFLWGPYFAFALHDWFVTEYRILPREATTVLFLLLYVHPAIHPLLYGVFMKDVRVKFGETISKIEKFVTCNQTELSYGEKTLSCLSSPRKSRSYVTNGFSHQPDSRPETPKPVGYGVRNMSEIPMISNMESEHLLACGRKSNSLSDITRDPIAQKKRRIRFSTSSNQISDINTDVGNNNNKKQERFPEIEDEVFKMTEL